MMYQLLNEQKTSEFNITSIVITYDIDFNRCNFVFYKSDLRWYQIYSDEGVIFINLIDDDFDEFLSDLNLVKSFEFLFYENNSFVLKHSGNQLKFIGNKYCLNFDILNDELIFNKNKFNL